jgi:hypothetical protein
MNGLLHLAGKKAFALFIFVVGIQFNLKAQHHADPPIPVEVFFGNNQLYYQTNVKKKFTSDSKFSFFSLATYTADYKNNLPENRLLIEAQLSYLIKSGFGVMVGTDINSVTGFAPIVGPQHTYASRQVLAVTIASYFLNEKNDFKIFGLYEYKPPISDKWSLYNRLQFIYNHSLKYEVHNRSYVYLRTGAKLDAFVFGLAANLDQFGPGKVYGDNYGVFFRWEFP